MDEVPCEPPDGSSQPASPAEPPVRAPQVSQLVPDISDRGPFGAEWADLGVEHVETFLTSTQDDEPLHWEAKGVSLEPDAVRRTVTAFANREGGYLIIGAERDTKNGAWTLPGILFPGTEPRTWLSNVIRTSVSPPPEFDIHAWDRPGALKAAVVRVQPNCGLLSISKGRIYYRRPGETSFIEDAGELQSVHDAVRYRSRALPGGGHPAPEQRPAPVSVGGTGPSMQMERDVAARVVEQLLCSEKPAAINIYLSSASGALQVAVAGGDDANVEDALDRITDVAAAAVSFEPVGPVAQRAVATLQSAFDLSLRARGGPTAFPSHRLGAEVIARARAVGALAVRLQHWPPLRHLIVHHVDEEHSRTWRNWFRYGDVQASRGGIYSKDQNVLEGSRAPLRLAAQHALRLATLRPDGIADEDALITGLCQFDFLTNVVATWEASGNRPSEAAFPYFAAWDGDRVQPASSWVIFDANCREALLPGIGDTNLAELLWRVARRAYESTQGLGSWGFWDGFFDARVQSFLNEHRMASGP